MFWHFYQKPRIAEPYNVGGSRHSHCSMLEAIEKCEAISGKKIDWTYQDSNRVGDHIWYISDVRKFEEHYPEWEYKYDLDHIINDLYSGLSSRL